LHEFEEGEFTSGDAVLVDEVRGEVGAEDGLEIGLGDALHGGIDGNEFGECLGESLGENLLAKVRALPEGGVLDGGVEGVDLGGDFFGEDEARFAAEFVFAPDAFKLHISVALNDVLDFLDIFSVEGREFLALHAHVFGVFLVGHGQRSEDFEGRGGDTTLVGGGVLVEHNASLFQNHAGIVRQEQVGTFNDKLEAWLALIVEHLINV